MGGGLTVLGRYTAARALRYAVAVLEQEAMQVSREMRLFQLPTEAFAGGKAVYQSLAEEVQQLRGPTPVNEALERRKRRESEVASQLATLVDQGEFAAAEELELAYAAECAAMSADEVAAIKAANTIHGDEATIKALKNWLAQPEAA